MVGVAVLCAACGSSQTGIAKGGDVDCGAGIVGEARPMIIGRLLRSRGTRPFYQIRLPAASRAVADALCTRIQSVGGNCVAMRS